VFTKEVAQNFHNIDVCSQQTLNLLSAAKIRGNNAFGHLLFIIDSLITVVNQLGLGKQCLPTALLLYSIFTRPWKEKQVILASSRTTLRCDAKNEHDL
jgi:hypothetical protein